MKNSITTSLIFVLLSLSILGSFSKINANTVLPDSIIFIKKNLDKQNDKEKLRSLKSLTLFYKDTISHIAQVYGYQYLKLAIELNSFFDQGEAHNLLAKTYRDQMDSKKKLYHNLESLKAYEQIGDSVMMSFQWLNVSDSYLLLHQYDSALNYYQLGFGQVLQQNDTAKMIYGMIQIGKVFSFQDKNAEALKKFEEAHKFAEQINHTNYLGWTGYWIGFTNMKLGNLTLAEKFLIESKNKYEEIHDRYGKIGPLQELGELYLKTGQYADAYRAFFDGVQNITHIPGKRGNINYQSTHYINIGKVYFTINEFDQAMAHYDTAMAIAEKHNFVSQTAIAKSNIGRVYFRKGDFEKALKHYYQALEYYKGRNSKYGIADLFNKIGGVYEYTERYETAIQYYSDALTINSEIDNKFGIAQNHCNLASVYKKTGNYQKMVSHLDAGIAFAKDTDVNHLLLKFYGNYIQYCEYSHDHQEARNFFNKYLPLAEKVNNDNIRNLSALLLEIQKNEMEKSNAIFEQEMSLQNLERERDELKLNQMFLFVIVVALIALITAMLFFFKTRTSRRLARLVEERTQKLRENEQKLIEINETREKFYSIIAHDLKSPFNSLIGFSNLLLEDYEDFSDAERKEFVEIIRNSSENIFNLLENLLDWSRRSSGDFQIKPIKTDLCLIVKKNIQLQEKNAASKNISIINKIPKNTFVFADENVVSAIIRNLTSNALKFTNAGGEISFEAKKTDGQIYCSVIDNGVGMTAEEIAKVLDTSKIISKKGTGKEKGTGLGLMLVSDFVNRSGGKLKIDSKKEEGSKFTFNLPAK
jgi:signal transduction histidine kinase